MFDTRYFTRENIRNRLLGRSAELWGYEESGLEHFDPLVKLMMEACAVEFESTGREIRDAEVRLTERLAALLCPEARVDAVPAYAIAQARPADAASHVHPEMTMVHTRKAGPPDQPKEVFFSPAASFPVVNAAVRFLATSWGLFEISGKTGQKSQVGKTLRHHSDSKSIWIGLETAASVKQWNGFRFFFNWPAHSAASGYPELLPATRWYAGVLPLQVRTGLDDHITDIQDEYRQDLLSTWQQRFVTIQSDGNGALPDERASYPTAFGEWFDEPVLKLLREPLLWLRVDFPPATPPGALDSLTVSLNAFPIINRRLHKIAYRLQPGLNGIALTSEEAFLGLHSVADARGEAYAAPEGSRSSSGDKAREYILRRRGMGRFDERNARSALSDLLELLRDEQSAFSALGEDFLNALLREMSQNIARLEQKIGVRRSFDAAPHPFLVIQCEKNTDTVHVSYWTTLAEHGNGLPPGSMLTPYGSSGAISGNAMLLTSPYGGRPAPSGREHISELRKNLTTRSRLVTAEDIRAYCLAELGEGIREVEIRHSYVAGTMPGHGFRKCIEVVLTASESLTDTEWSLLEQDILAKIKNRSVQLLPFRIVRALRK